MPPPANSPYRLMVEGPDDQWSIINLLTRHGYDWNDARQVRPHVHPTGGIAPLLEAASVASKTLQRLGIVVDADISVANRWASLRDRLASTGFHLPQDPVPTGVVVDRASDGRRVGVWMMPNNQRPGILEDFLTKLIPADDPCLAHASAVTTTARNLGAPLQEKDLAKGVIHTWLAWRENPGQPLGLAITSHVLSHDSPEALQFVAWFRRVFD
jgi:hypothetical protein